jgi:hypothetical protein
VDGQGRSTLYSFDRQMSLKKEGRPSARKQSRIGADFSRVKAIRGAASLPCADISSPWFILCIGLYAASAVEALDGQSLKPSHFPVCHITRTKNEIPSARI